VGANYDRGLWFASLKINKIRCLDRGLGTWADDTRLWSPLCPLKISVLVSPRLMALPGLEGPRLLFLG